MRSQKYVTLELIRDMASSTEGHLEPATSGGLNTRLVSEYDMTQWSWKSRCQTTWTGRARCHRARPETHALHMPMLISATV